MEYSATFLCCIMKNKLKQIEFPMSLQSYNSFGGGWVGCGLFGCCVGWVVVVCFIWVSPWWFFVLDVGVDYLDVCSRFPQLLGVLREDVFGEYLVFDLFGFLAVRQDMCLCFVCLST